MKKDQITKEDLKQKFGKFIIFFFSEELKPIQDQLLSTIEEEIRSLSQTTTNHDAFDALNMNQSLILKQLKKSSSSNSDDSVLTTWIENLVEELKKVQVIIWTF